MTDVLDEVCREAFEDGLALMAGGEDPRDVMLHVWSLLANKAPLLTAWHAFDVAEEILESIKQGHDYGQHYADA